MNRVAVVRGNDVGSATAAALHDADEFDVDGNRSEQPRPGPWPRAWEAVDFLLHGQVEGADADDDADQNGEESDSQLLVVTPVVMQGHSPRTG